MVLTVLLRTISALAYGRTSLAGITVVDATFGSEPLWFASRLEESLQLILSVNPQLYGRLRKGILRIVVLSEWRSDAGFVGLDRTCIFRQSALRSATPTDVAMILVHEATHARFDAAKIPYRHDNAARIEAACIREEMRFAANLPDAERIMSDAIADYSRQWWLNAFR